MRFLDFFLDINSFTSIHGALNKKKKVCISPIIKPIWLLSYMNCLYFFSISSFYNFIYFLFYRLYFSYLFSSIFLHPSFLSLPVPVFLSRLSTYLAIYPKPFLLFSFSATCTQCDQIWRNFTTSVKL